MSEETEVIESALNALARDLPEQLSRLDLDAVSVALDGSYVRGDFLSGMSDLDLTVTLRRRNPPAEAQLERRCNGRLAALPPLPPRPPGRKPLRFDLQWQTLEQVVESGRRRLSDWTPESIPPGYPKLWLYAFDGIRHHRVLYGTDVTAHYTRLPPQSFLPLRLARLRSSVLAHRSESSAYDRTYGTITQMKNAWETLRAAHLLQGGGGIAKPEVIASFLESPFAVEQRDFVRSIHRYYRTGVLPLPEPEFRRRLYGFNTGLLAELRTVLVF